ncbi:MAG: hypothetical protein ACD_73C00288G0001 [uncultured bacterium]|nr:MAG: hypothetical protein ACD_73C00288G0001 [uncultured bacterium]
MRLTLVVQIRLVRLVYAWRLMLLVLHLVNHVKMIVNVKGINIAMGKGVANLNVAWLQIVANAKHARIVVVLPGPLIVSLGWLTKLPNKMILKKE